MKKKRKRKINKEPEHEITNVSSIANAPAMQPHHFDSWEPNYSLQDNVS